MNIFLYETNVNQSVNNNWRNQWMVLRSQTNFACYMNLPIALTRAWFNIKMSSYQYGKSHCGDKTILRPSYLHNWISYTGKTTSLSWIGAQNTNLFMVILTPYCGASYDTRLKNKNWHQDERIKTEQSVEHKCDIISTSKYFPWIGLSIPL